MCPAFDLLVPTLCVGTHFRDALRRYCRGSGRLLCSHAERGNKTHKARHPPTKQNGPRPLVLKARAQDLYVSPSTSPRATRCGELTQTNTARLDSLTCKSG